MPFFETSSLSFVVKHLPVSLQCWRCDGLHVANVCTSTDTFSHCIEFTDHQRDVFCVFSGPGVSALREHFNHRAIGEDRSPSALYDPNDASDPNDPNALLDPSGIIIDSNAHLTNSEGESEGMEYPPHGQQVEVFYHHPSQEMPPYIINGEEDVTEVDVTEEDDDGIVEAGYVTNLMGEAALTAHTSEPVNGPVNGGHVIDMTELDGETLDGDTLDDDTIEEESDT